jgi:broad specificity phosphatase PhoE
MILIRHGQTEFNRVFSATRQDPGIRDPHLTSLGRRQALAVARVLSPLRLRRLITSPYIRAIETASIIAEELNLPIDVDPLTAERFCFTCDVGSPVAELRARWPDLTFDHLEDPWWPAIEETEDVILQRALQFRRWTIGEAWPSIGVVTHWGFIRAFTGLKIRNGTVLRVDPTSPEREPELVYVPTAA